MDHQPDKTGFQWIAITVNHDLPAKAVIAGKNADGSTNYVAITTYYRDQLVVNLVHSKRDACLSYKGAAYMVNNCQVLIGDGFVWQSVTGDQLPDGAVSSGFLADFEKCYIGRATHEGCLRAGKIIMSQRCLFVAFDGVEHRKETFEVLVAPKKTGRLAYLVKPFLWLLNLYRKTIL